MVSFCIFLERHLLLGYIEARRTHGDEQELFTKLQDDIKGAMRIIQNRCCEFYI